jgi:hypothetical protein
LTQLINPKKSFKEINPKKINLSSPLDFKEKSPDFSRDLGK